MNTEIERKFLFTPRLWSQRPSRTETFEQGYLSDSGQWEIRLRRSAEFRRMTLKTGKDRDRGEWEANLSPAEFDGLWTATLGRRIAKRRETYPWKSQHVEVDHYQSSLDGLVVAEVEFQNAEAARAFVPPAAFGPEITYDPRYKNRALAEAPHAVPRTFAAKDEGWSYGVLPYRRSPRGWELVVISTRRQDRWIFPKGQPEPGQSPEKVALNEAQEEAGISGKVGGHPIVLPYVRDSGTTNLLLFPLLVTRLADRYLELGQRERQVIPLSAAAQYGDVIARGARWIEDFKGTVGSSTTR